MTRNEAINLVAQRWARLGLSASAQPNVFSSDVDNMLAEHANIAAPKFDVEGAATGISPSLSISPSVAMISPAIHDGLTLSRLEVAVLNAELKSRLSAEDRDPEPENERFR